MNAAMGGTTAAGTARSWDQCQCSHMHVAALEKSSVRRVDNEIISNLFIILPRMCQIKLQVSHKVYATGLNFMLKMTLD